MAAQNRNTPCWLSLALTTFLLPLAASSPRQLAPTTLAGVPSTSQHSSRHLQGTAVTPGGPGVEPGSPGVVPSNPGDDDVTIAMAKEGEQCNSGGNLMPVPCEPGLTCNTTAPQPTPGAPGFRPDDAAVGFCVRATNTTSALLAKEGENCTTAGSATQPAVSCGDGLFCDVLATLPQPDVPRVSESSSKGVCRRAPSPGNMCYAGGVVAPSAVEDTGAGVKAQRMSSTPASDSPWSAPCAAGLVCFVLDPSPLPCENQSAVLSKMGSMDMSNVLLGYCVNQSDVPSLNSRQGAGTLAGVCKVGIPMEKADSPCQVGLTCASPSGMVQMSGAGAVTYGVCADPGVLLPQSNGASMAGNGAEGGAVATRGSTAGPTSPFAAAKSTTQLLYRRLGLVALSCCLALSL